MAEESLITDEVRALVGRTGPVREAEVTEDAVRRSMGVYGAVEPELPAEGERVPGYAIMSISQFGESEELGLPQFLPRSILVSNEFSLERPIRLGEKFSVQSRIADITERLGGQFGHSIYVHHENEFRDADGNMVGKTATTMMYYDTAGRRSEDS